MSTAVKVYAVLRCLIYCLLFVILHLSPFYCLLCVSLPQTRMCIFSVMVPQTVTHRLLTAGARLRQLTAPFTAPTTYRSFHGSDN